MVTNFANWFKKLRTHIGMALAREEVDGLREYSFMAEQRAQQAQHELDTSKEWRLLVHNTMRSSHEWREELSRKMANAYASQNAYVGQLDKEHEEHLRSDIAARIIYNIIRDALRGYTVEFSRHKDPESDTEFAHIRVDTITFKNQQYVGTYSIPIRRPLAAPR